jgi:hypothetical protein
MVGAMVQAKTELVVIDKAYQLLVWCSERIARFPRSHRFTVGQRLEGRLAGILESLLRAKYNRDRGPLRRQVNLELELLRFQLRLAKDLKCWSVESYGHAARTVNEVGQMVGGWIKQTAAEAPGGANKPDRKGPGGGPPDREKKHKRGREE